MPTALVALRYGTGGSRATRRVTPVLAGGAPFFALAFPSRWHAIAVALVEFSGCFKSYIDYATPSSIHVTLLVVCCFCASPYPPARFVLRTSAVQSLANL